MILFWLRGLSLIKQIPRILSPDLNKAGKAPTLLTHSGNMVAEVDEVKSMIKFQMNKLLCLAVAVGHVKMTDEDLCTTSTWLSTSWCHCSRKVGSTSGPCPLKALWASPSNLY